MSRFWMFFCTVVFLLLLMQVYLAFSISSWLGSLPISDQAATLVRWLFLAILLYFNMSIPLRLVIRAFPGHDFTLLKRLVIFPGTTWLITMLMMVVLFVSRDAASWIWKILVDDPADPGRRAFLQITGTLALGAPFVMTGYGALRTARDYKVKRLELQFPNLPRELDGFQIAQISDLHSGIYMDERHMMQVREIIDSLRPQVLAMTGDYVDTLADEVGPVAQVFSRAKTDYGVFACMGNHDLFDDYRKIRAAMVDAGIKMLDNAHEKIKVGGEALAIAGVGDAGRSYSYARLDQALSGVPHEMFKVLLAHRPGFFPKSQEAQIDLQLSGHTHGGQIAMPLGPITLNPVYLFEKYARGLYSEGNSKLYVNPGIGMVFAPIRIGVPPEITLITLRSNH